MEKLGLNTLRKKFLDFFSTKDHLIAESASLVPQGDKSMLIINSGMAPFKPYFSGEKTPPKTRIATCQKCVRVNDIENVGKTSRHGTFFEMLGNFSFGDYFKKEALTWSWEFLTQILGIPPEKLYPSVYIEDDEAFDIWNTVIGLPGERITRLGKHDNFWELGVGPCGPSSEIYFDRGESVGCGSPNCAPGCDCDRFIEIWNNVFTQFNSDGKGNYTLLEKKNIDTGMGLDRLAIIMQGVNTIIEIDTNRVILDKVCQVSNKKYNTNERDDVAIRIITDHIKSATFMISDNILPSNEGRGYVLRRVLRRAARYGKLLGIKGAFLFGLCDTVIDINCEAYPELGRKRDYIKKILKAEEDRFAATLDAGLAILSDMISQTLSKNESILAGEHIFKLYDTYGFPYDLTLEICEEKGLALDKEGFDDLMAKQRKRARDARANIEGWSKDKLSFVDKNLVTEFTGYETTSGELSVAMIITEEDGSIAEVNELSEGEFIMIADKTPFYAESGGQVGDTGTLSREAAGVEIAVTDTKKTADGKIFHICRLETGIIKKGMTLFAAVNEKRRAAITRNHSAAHLLQAALRKVLGNTVEQAGSYVDEFRLRFDFSHYKAMSGDEVAQVEAIVNENIFGGAKITTTVTDSETAKKMGALALFGEKYGSVVRVVKMGEFSTELCGGTHLSDTARAGIFKIVSEASVASGVRRIEAMTAMNVFDELIKKEMLINSTADILKTNNPLEMAKKAEQLQLEVRELKKEIELYKTKAVTEKVPDLLAKAEKIGEIDFVTAKFDDMGMDSAKILAEELKARNPKVAAVIATISGGKLNFTAVCGADAVKAGANAGAIVKAAAAATGGGGGGRPEFAAAGGRDMNKIDDAFKSSKAVLMK